DDDGDERYGDSPGLDEAFVPYDYMTAGLLVDDEIGRCCEEIPKGVSVTFFMDCCHSGTNTRFFIAGSDVQENGVKARYLPPSKDMIAAHRKARASRGLSRGVSAYKGKSEILFSACLSTQVAYETNGQGDFTRHSMDVLAQTNGQLTCRDFVDEVSRRFGARRRQTPDLVCDESLEDTALLAPRGQVDTSGPPAGDDSKSDRDGNLRDVLLEIRRLLENV
ncbi:MAG: caspase family protein, partial [Planctomycetales bacterium]|nr:caspase family protein [Planctomycetales bacterium]